MCSSHVGSVREESVRKVVEGREASHPGEEEVEGREGDVTKKKCTSHCLALDLWTVAQPLKASLGQTWPPHPSHSSSTAPVGQTTGQGAQGSAQLSAHPTAMTCGEDGSDNRD